MDVSVWVLVAASICTAIFASVTAPLILARRTERMHREDQLADYKRQDEVAKKAAEAAEVLVQSQKVIADQAAEAARLLVVNNKLVAQTSNKIAGQLTNIHTLVNSNLTVAKQSELSALQGQLALVKEVIELKYATGNTPGAETLATRDAINRKIENLSLDLADRAEAAAGVAKLAEAELETQRREEEEEEEERRQEEERKKT